MIIDNLKNCKSYTACHKDFEKVFEFFKTLNENTEKGKHVLVENEVWVNVFEATPTPNEEKHFEAHRDFIDIHYIIKGGEVFGYANLDTLKPCKEYDKENDYELLDGKINKFAFNEGDFCVTLPQDGHIPAIESLNGETVLRAVAKVKI